MSDQNKYINTYIDNAISISHDFMVQVVQLKTQLKISNDLVQEKDQVISALVKEKEESSSSLKTENERITTEFRSETEKLQQCRQEINNALNNARHWEDQFNAMKNKVSHIDTLTEIGRAHV